MHVGSNGVQVIQAAASSGMSQSPHSHLLDVVQQRVLECGHACACFSVRARTLSTYKADAQMQLKVVEAI
jgi:hypothetical protein